MIIGSVFHPNNLEVKRLDWNKTKTIFIVVFSILNVFLYSLYLDRYKEAQSVQLVGENSIEESLKLDNISYKELPDYNEESSYASAEVSVFTEESLKSFKDQEFTIVEKTLLTSVVKAKFPIRNTKGDYLFPQFLATHVPKGKEYVLWDVDDENNEAVFFQKVNDYPIYFNQNAMLKIYWDKDENITNYEQRMFGEFISFNKKKDLLSPIEAINTLYSRDHLQRNSTVKSVSLGYSTDIQLTKTQVFAPTWRVRVELEDGSIEDYFINAREGKIVEFPNEPDEELEENE